jgi:hypothetical protein
MGEYAVRYMRGKSVFFQSSFQLPGLHFISDSRAYLNVPPTRLLHVSDTHLGNRQYGSDIRRDDFADAFERAIQIAIDRAIYSMIQFPH